MLCEQEAAYRALIGLGSSHFESHGKQLRLVPGMQVSAEIQLGTRSVLEYLHSSVQTVIHEATGSGETSAEYIRAV